NFESAAENFGYNKLVIAGGVSANSKLRAEAKKICDRHGWDLYLPELKYCGDNAAMIASQGYYEYKSGTVAKENLNAYATMPLDDLQY
ncbi:MAG: tRNA (adenosine(37)-N6)-threonylcarbamoyltransferase complex transferase subunit TsaD, partial [Clostridia bacterium]|nr:tRNA (adenosine(37)-N6)-threonylcarbamoyltransferase complex transferase subunit TsaD [Clostridia bacterium]